jgi:hypothetical protein
MSLPLEPDKRHKKQAEHNLELLREDCFQDPCSSKNLLYKDWNITIVFYTALHYMQCYLFQKGYRTSFNDHSERNNYLARLSSTDRIIAKVTPAYIALFKATLSTRYTPCYYHYISQKDVCEYTKFVLQTLPKELGII